MVVLRGLVVEEYYSSDGAMPIVALFDDGDLLPGIIAISLGWGITALNIFLMKDGHK